MRWWTFLIQGFQTIQRVLGALKILQPYVNLSEYILSRSLHARLHIIATAVYWFQGGKVSLFSKRPL